MKISIVIAFTMLLGISIPLAQCTIQQQHQKPPIVHPDTPICSSIQMGTDATRHKHQSDIIKNGVAQPGWEPSSNNPMIIGPVRELYYINLKKPGFNITKENLQVTYSPLDAADSVKAAIDQNPDWYTLEIAFKCKSYGAQLITYTIEVFYPDCGGVKVEFMKLCGNPFTERSGFSMGLETKIPFFKEQVVKNGRVIVADRWDIDIQNKAVNLPANVDVLLMDIWMDENDLQTTDTSNVHTFSNINQTFDANQTNSQQATVNAIDIYSDKDFLQAHLRKFPPEGVTLRPGEKQQYEIHFHCRGYKGFSTIEVDIEIKGFKDINVFFVKDCDEVGNHHLLRKIWPWVFIVVVVLGMWLMYVQTEDEDLEDLKGLIPNMNVSKAYKYLKNKATGLGQATMRKYQQLNQRETNNASIGAEPDTIGENVEMNELKFQKVEEDDDEIIIEGTDGDAKDYGTF